LEKQKREEELKERIFNVYSKYHDEPSSDRRQVYYGQLCELVFKWCREHIYYKETEKMGLEIVEAVKRCAEKEIPEEDFFKYLRTSLGNAEKQYYRDCLIEGSLKMPRIITEIKNLIRMEESYEGRELTQNEIVDLISRWKGISENKARIYFENMNKKLISNTDDDDNKLDIVDSIPSHYLTYQDEATEDNETVIIMDALESVLKKTREKTKPLYKAFFTLRCIETNIKYYRKLWSMLDSEILENYWKTLTVPCQYEIYMKYHPEAKKSTAEANASQMSKKFFADLDKAIKEKSEK